MPRDPFKASLLVCVKALQDIGFKGPGLDTITFGSLICHFIILKGFAFG